MMLNVLMVCILPQCDIFFVPGNDESDESEESHDEDEEEDVPASYSPARNNNELEPDSLDDLNDGPELNTSDLSALWPIQ